MMVGQWSLALLSFQLGKQAWKAQANNLKTTQYSLRIKYALGTREALGPT